VGDAPDRRRGLPRAAAWLALAVVAALALAAALLAGQVRDLGADLDAARRAVTPQVVDRSRPPVLESVRDLAELRAASGDYQVVLDVETDVRFVPSAIAGERTIFVASGTVDAAVDLSQLGEDAVEVAPDGSVVLTLPPVELTAPRLDPDGTYVFDRERGLLDRVGDAVGDDLPDDQALYQQAEQALADAAADSDLADRAEANAAEVLRTLLEGLGYDDVEVRFEAAPRRP
jgi:hypothetical protein